LRKLDTFKKQKLLNICRLPSYRWLDSLLRRFLKGEQEIPSEKMGMCKGFQKESKRSPSKKMRMCEVFKREQEIPNREDGHV